MEYDLFVNLKLSRQFTLNSINHSTLIAYVEGRNILNRANVKWVDSNGKIGGELSDPGAYYEPRRVWAGMRIEF